jgi:hypothetical protein
VQKVHGIMALPLAWLDCMEAAQWWLAMASRAVRSRAAAEAIAEVEGESEREEEWKRTSPLQPRTTG